MPIESLNSLVLPSSLGISRDPGICPDDRPANFDSTFDFYTLFYDAIYVARERSICLVCPKLDNFESVVQQGLFMAGNEMLKPSIRHFGKFDEIWLPCSSLPKTLRIRIGSFETEMQVSLQDEETFRGHWCAFLKSKDNELIWIRDWAEYHVKVHGLQGIVFFDNGSSKYSLQDVDDALCAVKGLEHVTILSAPFPFGPILFDFPKPHARAFLEWGLTSIARWRYLTSASAVLVCDIDELVAPVSEGSIFSLAENSPMGYVLFAGNWRYPGSMENPVRHVDHVYRARWLPRNRRGGAIDATKYCICPNGPLGLHYWGIHRLMPVPPSKTISAGNPVTDRAEYWHCRRITTDWKVERRLQKFFRLKLDGETKQVLDSVLA